MELPLGALCGVCRGDIERRAGRVAMLVAAGSTILVAIYIIARIPPGQPTARNVGMAGIAIWFLLSFTTVKSIMRQWTK